jgi:uncharacterized protein
VAIISWKNETTLILRVRVVPGSKKTAYDGVVNESLRILIKAQPTDNEANEALIKFLSKEFKVPQARINIISGQKSRSKVIELEAPRRLPDYLKDFTP